MAMPFGLDTVKSRSVSDHSPSSNGRISHLVSANLSESQALLVKFSSRVEAATRPNVATEPASLQQSSPERIIILRPSGPVGVGKSPLFRPVVASANPSSSAALLSNSTDPGLDAGDTESETVDDISDTYPCQLRVQHDTTFSVHSPSSSLPHSAGITQPTNIVCRPTGRQNWPTPQSTVSRPERQPVTETHKLFLSPDKNDALGPPQDRLVYGSQCSQAGSALAECEKNIGRRCDREKEKTAFEEKAIVIRNEGHCKAGLVESVKICPENPASSGENGHTPQRTRKGMMNERKNIKWELEKNSGSESEGETEVRDNEDMINVSKNINKEKRKPITHASEALMAEEASGISTCETRNNAKMQVPISIEHTETVDLITPRNLREKESRVEENKVEQKHHDIKKVGESMKREGDQPERRSVEKPPPEVVSSQMQARLVELFSHAEVVRMIASAATSAVLSSMAGWDRGDASPCCPNLEDVPVRRQEASAISLHSDRPDPAAFRPRDDWFASEPTSDRACAWSDRLSRRDSDIRLAEQQMQKPRDPQGLIAEDEKPKTDERIQVDTPIKWSDADEDERSPVECEKFGVESKEEDEIADLSVTSDIDDFLSSLNLALDIDRAEYTTLVATRGPTNFGSLRKVSPKLFAVLHS